MFSGRDARVSQPFMSSSVRTVSYRPRRRAASSPVSQGGELFDVRNEEINQTRVRVKVHVSELFLHRNAALHAAERDAARSLV